MAFVVLPGRNRIVALAFAGLRADERKAKKAAAPAQAVVDAAGYGGLALALHWFGDEVIK